MSNKLRLIRIYELRGKVHPIEQMFIDLLDSLEKTIYIEYILYYKDDKYFFSYHPDYNRITVFSPTYSIFNCSKDETKDIMKYLLEKHLCITINRIF